MMLVLNKWNSKSILISLLKEFWVHIKMREL